MNVIVLATIISNMKLADVITSILSNSVSIIIGLISFIYARKAHKKAIEAHDRINKQDNKNL